MQLTTKAFLNFVSVVAMLQNHIPFFNIPRIANSISITFWTDYILSDFIPKRAHSILKTYQKRENSVSITIFQFEQSPKQAHFVLITFLKKVYVPFWSHSKPIMPFRTHFDKGTFHIPKKLHSKKGTFHFKHIPNIAHSLLITFITSFRKIPLWSLSVLVTFHFGHIPFRSHSILVTFHFGYIPFWSYSKESTFQ